MRKPRVERDSIISTIFSEDSTSPSGIAYSGVPPEGRSKDVTGYARLTIMGKDEYLSADDIHAAIVRHKMRTQREEVAQEATIRQQNRAALRVAREKAREDKHQEKSRKHEDRMYWHQMDMSNKDYKAKIRDLVNTGNYRCVMAMIYKSEQMVQMVAYADGWGHFTTLDGLTWFPFDDTKIKYITHRSPAHRNSRGESWILIPISSQRDKPSRLGKTRLSFSGITQAEAEIALRAIREERAKKHE